MAKPCLKLTSAKTGFSQTDLYLHTLTHIRSPEQHSKESTSSSTAQNQVLLQPPSGPCTQKSRRVPRVRVAICEKLTGPDNDSPPQRAMPVSPISNQHRFRKVFELRGALVQVILGDGWPVSIFSDV